MHSECFWKNSCLGIEEKMGQGVGRRDQSSVRISHPFTRLPSSVNIFLIWTEFLQNIAVAFYELKIALDNVNLETYAGSLKMAKKIFCPCHPPGPDPCSRSAGDKTPVAHVYAGLSGQVPAQGRKWQIQREAQQKLLLEWPREGPCI